MRRTPDTGGPWHTRRTPQWAAGLDEGARWAVLAPHPDDELLMAYGLLRRWPSTVRVFILTDGAKGVEPGLEFLSPQELTARRYSESLQCAARLGIGSDQLCFLGLPDGRLETCSADGDGGAQRMLQGVLEAYAPHIVIAPHPCELHPDHRWTGACLANIAGGFLKLFTCYPRGLSLGNPAYALRLTAEEWERKRALAKGFATQAFVADKLADPFYKTERFWAQEQLPAPWSGARPGTDTPPRLFSRTDVLANTSFRYLSDSTQEKQARVKAALAAKVAIYGTDPWGFRQSLSERVRIERTVGMILDCGPVHVVDCGCAAGETLAVLRASWPGPAVGIEANETLAAAAAARGLPFTNICMAEAEDALADLADLDTLVLTELCYYFHPPEWHRLCETQFQRAQALVFSMRPADAALPYISPLLRAFDIRDVCVIAADGEPMNSGWLLARMQRR